MIRNAFFKHDVAIMVATGSRIEVRNHPGDNTDTCKICQSHLATGSAIVSAPCVSIQWQNIITAGIGVMMVLGMIGLILLSSLQVPASEPTPPVLVPTIQHRNVHYNGESPPTPGSAFTSPRPHRARGFFVIGENVFNCSIFTI